MLGEERATSLVRRYNGAFPISYRDTVSARGAVRDIEVIDKLDTEHQYAVNLYRPVEGDERTLRLRAFRLGASMPLSASLPVLETWASRCWTRFHTRSRARASRRCSCTTSGCAAHARFPTWRR